MAEVVPLPTAQSSAVHISELIRIATDVSDITARLMGKPSQQQLRSDEAVPTAENDGDDDAAPATSLLDASDSDGRTAFHWCLALRRYDLATALAAKGAAVATVDLDGTSTLATACSVDAPAEILQLIGNGMRDGSGARLWNAADTAGNTPLLYLASRGNVKGLRWLLSTIPSGTVLRFRPVERAEEAKRKHQEAFANNNNTPGEHKNAVVANAPSGVTELDDDAATDETPNTISSSPPAYCDLFAQNKRQQTALHRAVSKGSQDFVEELLSFVKHHVAAGDVGTMRNFINAPDNQGNTVLHYASMENNEDLGKYLLRNGATRDAKNKKGQEFWQL